LTRTRFICRLYLRSVLIEAHGRLRACLRAFLAILISAAR
jgi:hypothetical protein